MQSDQPSTDGLLENAIAISAVMHGSENFATFYDIIGHKVGGFTGIYDLCAEMARALSAYENEHGGQHLCWEEQPDGLDWAEVTERFVDSVMSAGIKHHATPPIQGALRACLHKKL